MSIIPLSQIYFNDENIQIPEEIFTHLNKYFESDQISMVMINDDAWFGNERFNNTLDICKKKSKILDWACGTNCQELYNWLIILCHQKNEPVDQNIYYDLLGKCYEYKNYQFGEIIISHLSQPINGKKLGMAFHYACLHDNMEYAEKLLNLASDIDLHWKNVIGFSTIIECCKCGNTKIIKWLLDLCTKLNQNFDLEKNYNYMIELAAFNNKSELVKWLLSLEINNKNLIQAFNQCCSRGNFELAQWIYDQCLIQSLSLDLYSAFSSTCYGDNLEVARWLREKIILNKNLLFNCIKQNCSSISRSKLIKWLFELIDEEKIILTVEEYEEIFKKIIWNNDFELTRFILGRSNNEGKSININLEENYALRRICLMNKISKNETHNNMKFYQWFYQYSLDNQQYINIHDKNDEAFINALTMGDIEIAEWLINLGMQNNNPINLNFDQEKPFRSVIECGDLELAQWLINTCEKMNSPINFRAKNDKSFKYLCKKHMINEALFLKNLVKEYSLLINNGLIESYNIHNN